MSRRVRCWLSLIVTLVFFLGLFPSGTTAFAQSEIEFTDVDGHWAKETITKWVQQGLIKGYTDGTFRPDDSITRAEFMALVNRAFGISEKGSNRILRCFSK